ncbi:MAG: hypothetical protein NWF04_07420 [Candidatus Bathyarchaeota archaeon]|nr:hypothetical protein [Candidatus Bathyarchaeota archaeon]
MKVKGFLNSQNSSGRITCIFSANNKRIAAIVTTVFKATPHIGVLGLNVFWMYLTLGSRVRKTRKAFKQQLTAKGMSAQDTKRLSACYEDLKNNLTATLKQGITSAIPR